MSKMPDRERDRERDRGGDRGSERGSDRDRDRDRDRHHRNRDRDRDRDRDRRDRHRSRSKSRSPHSRRRSPGFLAGPSGNHDEPENLTEEEKQMREILGFANFHSTKGKKVEGNNVGAVHVIMKRKYRQYMNRKGGFNRPLDFVA